MLVVREGNVVSSTWENIVLTRSQGSVLGGHLFNLYCLLLPAGAREETKDGDGWQRALQGVCSRGKKADLAGQPGSVWGWSLTSPKTVHCGEGSSSVQQRPLHPAQFLQPFSKNTTPRRGELQSTITLASDLFQTKQCNTILISLSSFSSHYNLDISWTDSTRSPFIIRG